MAATIRTAPVISANTLKQVFIVPANGPEALQHYQETVHQKRTISEVARFISPDDLKILRGMYHEAPFAVWGATSGTGNRRTFANMDYGDYILFSQRGRIVLIGEIAWKLTNRELAKYFWRTNPLGNTWENIYFIINEHELNVPNGELWQYLDYEPDFRLQGLMQIDEDRVAQVEQRYGGFYDILVRLNHGQSLIERSAQQQAEAGSEKLPEDEEKPREHDEIQWRLIRLGHSAKVDVWVPQSDQGREWEGNRFKQYVLSEFKAGLDIPRTVENIDAVWRFGYQIRAAFEIEHSSSVYSGLLRLSDLKTVAPNSNYPLYIAAPKERRDKVFSELKRPTFHDQLRLHETVRFISYDKVRELDDEYGERKKPLRLEVVDSASERVS